MQTLTIGRSVYKLSPVRNSGEFVAQLAKCTGKHRKLPIGKCRRGYPIFVPGMSTAEYVDKWHAINSHVSIKDARGFFGPLNTEPAAVYTGADTFEECAELAQDSAAPVNSAAELAPVNPGADDAAPAAESGPGRADRAPAGAMGAAEPIARATGPGSSEPAPGAAEHAEPVPGMSAPAPADRAATGPESGAAGPDASEAHRRATIARAADTLHRLSMLAAPDSGRAAAIAAGRAGTGAALLADRLQRFAEHAPGADTRGAARRAVWELAQLDPGAAPAGADEKAELARRCADRFGVSDPAACAHLEPFAAWFAGAMRDIRAAGDETIRRASRRAGSPPATQFGPDSAPLPAESGPLPVDTAPAAAPLPVDTPEPAAPVKPRRAPPAAPAADVPPPMAPVPADPVRPAARAPRDGDTYRIHERSAAGTGGAVWTAADVRTARRAHEVAQCIIGGWISGARWATCAETGALLFGIDAAGRECMRPEYFPAVPLPADTGAGPLPDDSGAPGAELAPEPAAPLPVDTGADSRPAARRPEPEFHGVLYRVHCATYSRARQLRGLPGFLPGQGMATAADSADPLVTFRAFARYRTAGANALRAQVAAAIRAERARRTLAPLPVNPAPVHRYALVNRPAMLGAIPRGVDCATEPRPAPGAPHHEMARHGFLICTRALTDAECSAFELARLADGPELAESIAAELAEHAAEYCEHADEDGDSFVRHVLRTAARLAEPVRVSIADPAGMVAAVLARLRLACPPAPETGAGAVSQDSSEPAATLEHAGPVFVMMDHDTTVGHCPTIAAGRLEAAGILAAEPFACTVSLYSESGEWLEDCGGTAGRGAFALPAAPGIERPAGAPTRAESLAYWEPLAADGYTGAARIVQALREPAAPGPLPVILEPSEPAANPLPAIQHRTGYGLRTYPADAPGPFWVIVGDGQTVGQECANLAEAREAARAATDRNPLSGRVRISDPEGYEVAGCGANDPLPAIPADPGAIDAARAELRAAADAFDNGEPGAATRLADAQDAIAELEEPGQTAPAGRPESAADSAARAVRIFNSEESRAAAIDDAARFDGAPAGPCMVCYGAGPARMVSRARAAYLIRAGRSRSAGNVRRLALHRYAIGDAAATLETARDPAPLPAAPEIEAARAPAGDSGLSAWVAEMQAAGNARRARAAALAAGAELPEFGGGSVRFVHEKDPARFGLAGPCMSTAGRFRFSHFDERGAVGDMGFTCLADACDEALSMGYLPVAPGAPDPGGLTIEAPAAGPLPVESAPLAAESEPAAPVADPAEVARLAEVGRSDARTAAAGGVAMDQALDDQAARMYRHAADLRRPLNAENAAYLAKHAPENLPGPAELARVESKALNADGAAAILADEAQACRAEWARQRAARPIESAAQALARGSDEWLRARIEAAAPGYVADAAEAAAQCGRYLAIAEKSRRAGETGPASIRRQAAFMRERAAELTAPNAFRDAPGAGHEAVRVHDAKCAAAYVAIAAELDRAADRADLAPVILETIASKESALTANGIAHYAHMPEDAATLARIEAQAEALAAAGKLGRFDYSAQGLPPAFYLPTKAEPAPGAESAPRLVPAGMESHARQTCAFRALRVGDAFQFDAGGPVWIRARGGFRPGCGGQLHACAPGVEVIRYTMCDPAPATQPEAAPLAPDTQPAAAISQPEESPAALDGLEVAELTGDDAAQAIEAATPAPMPRAIERARLAANMLHCRLYRVAIFPNGDRLHDVRISKIEHTGAGVEYTARERLTMGALALVRRSTALELCAAIKRGERAAARAKVRAALAMRGTPPPRIPVVDPRARIPARFAPGYVLNAR